MRLLSLFFSSLLLSACGTMQIGERNFIHPDKPGTASAPRLVAAPLLPPGTLTEEEIATPDGAVLRGLGWRSPGATRTVLYFGGNAFHLDQHGKALLPLLAGCGVSVMVFDYRGYGRSSGVPTVSTLAADALRLYDHASEQYPGGVIVHGQSLGSFMAAHVARHRPAARAVVLEATAANVQDWVDANVPWYLKLVTKVQVEGELRGIDNLAAVAAYRGPSLVLAGGADRITPARLGRRVHEAFAGEAKQWRVAGDAGHNAIFGHKDVMPAYCELVNAR